LYANNFVEHTEPEFYKEGDAKVSTQLAGKLRGSEEEEDKRKGENRKKIWEEEEKGRKGEEGQDGGRKRVWEGGRDFERVGFRLARSAPVW
jgi:hypothetical protein